MFVANKYTFIYIHIHIFMRKTSQMPVAGRGDGGKGDTRKQTINMGQ